MLDFDIVKDVMLPSINLWRAGHHSEALKLVDTWIAKAEEGNQSATIQILSMHASIIAESMGDFGLVRRYAEQALSRESGHTRGKALALYKLADAMFHQGETDLAKRYAARSYSLVSQTNSEEYRGLLELLSKTWPDVASWQS